MGLVGTDLYRADRVEVVGGDGLQAQRARCGDVQGWHGPSVSPAPTLSGSR